jgi:hypothetical protein
VPANSSVSLYSYSDSKKDYAMIEQNGELFERGADVVFAKGEQISNNERIGGLPYSKAPPGGVELEPEPDPEPESEEDTLATDSNPVGHF